MQQKKKKAEYKNLFVNAKMHSKWAEKNTFKGKKCKNKICNIKSI